MCIKCLFQQICVNLMIDSVKVPELSMRIMHYGHICLFFLAQYVWRCNLQTCTPLVMLKERQVGENSDADNC